jgi:pentose-5-phosphate-3-epimerase
MGVDRVFGQVEMMADMVAFIEEAQFEGMEVGLAYDIETPIEGVEKYINDIDAVLLMAVKAGAQGNHFDERVFEKIKQIRKLNKRITIVVDGGLDEDKIRRCLAAEWAEELAEGELLKSTMGMEFSVGSHLLKSENVIEEYENLQHLKNNHG